MSPPARSSRKASGKAAAASAAAPELSALLRRLAETLSFAGLLEEHPELRPADLRRLLAEAADRLASAATAAVPVSSPAAVPVAFDEDGELRPVEEREDEELEDGELDDGELEAEFHGEQSVPGPAALLAKGQSVETILVDVYVDGASKGNPGPSAVGYVLSEPGGLEFVAEGRYIGRATNNDAEYRALLRALDAAEKYGFRRLRIHSDSELLVKQLRGQYKVNSPSLRPLWEVARKRLDAFDEAELLHVPREQNKRADELANQAIKAIQKRAKAAQAAERKRAKSRELP